MKKCTKCQIIKELTEFYKHKSFKDGHQYICKKCSNQRHSSVEMKEYYKKREELRKEREYYKKEFNDFPERVLLREAKFRAKKQGLECNLELSDIIIPEKCPLLNIQITRNRKVKELGEKKSRVQTNPSIDRIDNSKGYIKDNIWIISVLANTMKSNASIEQLITFSKSVLKRFNYDTNNDDINMHRTNINDSV